MAIEARTVTVMLVLALIASCSGGEERIDAGNSELGEACQNDSDCGSNLCRYADSLRVVDNLINYCTVNCVTDEDCYVAFGEENYCCVQREYEEKYCQMIQPGYSCGTREGVCADFCDGQFDSACADGFYCTNIGPGKIICANRCESDQDCRGCVGKEGLMGAIFYCYGDGSEWSFCYTED